MLDKSLSFGTQNFLFVEVSEEDEVYDFVSYMTKKGSILIAQYPKDGNSALYWLGSGVYATIWDTRTELSYRLPNELTDANV